GEGKDRHLISDDVESAFRGQRSLPLQVRPILPTPASAARGRKPYTVRGSDQLPSARCRKAAICPRVTKSLGQNRLFCGGLQPRVTPAAATRWLSPSTTDPLSSMTRLPPPSLECFRARTRKA